MYTLLLKSKINSSLYQVFWFIFPSLLFSSTDDCDTIVL